MSIDITRNPMEIFADHINHTNPHLPDLNAGDIAVRNLQSALVESWPKAVDKGLPDILSGYPQAQYVYPSEGWDAINGSFIVKKEIYFNGGDVLCTLVGRDTINVYVDGVLEHTASDYMMEHTELFEVKQGLRVIVIECISTSGYAGIAVAFDGSGVVHVVDDTWACKVTTGTPATSYMDHTNETLLEVDLLAPGNSPYVAVKYERIPVEVLFGVVDVDGITRGVQLTYHLDDIDMLAGAVDNFKSIYESWYRFSHTSSGVYPGIPAELEGWAYIEEYDCIQSTINSSSYVGFISDNLETDYVFNTVLTSNNGDDDGISIILAALKQGDVDAKEHTLGLMVATGGWNGSYIRVNEDHRQVGEVVTRIIDPGTRPPNSGGIGAWSLWYAHVYAKRVGSKITIWVKRERLPALEAGQTRDEGILQLVEDVAGWGETDFIANDYMTTVIDLEVEATIFNRPCYSGYGQFSQTGARFWNIQRPGANPAVTPKLRQWFLDHYGYNMGEEGVTVESLGSSKFRMVFDNILYRGVLEMLPEVIV